MPRISPNRIPLRRHYFSSCIAETNIKAEKVEKFPAFNYFDVSVK